MRDLTVLNFGAQAGIHPGAKRIHSYLHSNMNEILMKELEPDENKREERFNSDEDVLRCIAKDAGYDYEDRGMELADPPTADQYEEE